MERTVHLHQQMSLQDFALLGINQIAYLRPDRREGVEGFVVCSADGTEMAYIPNNREVAFAAVRQYDLEPFSVH